MHLLADDVIGRTSVNTLIDMVRNLTSVPQIRELTKIVGETRVSMRLHVVRSAFHSDPDRGQARLEP